MVLMKAKRSLIAPIAVASFFVSKNGTSTALGVTKTKKIKRIAGGYSILETIVGASSKIKSTL